MGTAVDEQARECGRLRRSPRLVATSSGPAGRAVRTRGRHPDLNGADAAVACWRRSSRPAQEANRGRGTRSKKMAAARVTWPRWTRCHAQRGQDHGRVLRGNHRAGRVGLAGTAPFARICPSAASCGWRRSMVGRVLRNRLYSPSARWALTSAKKTPHATPPAATRAGDVWPVVTVDPRRELYGTRSNKTRREGKEAGGSGGVARGDDPPKTQPLLTGGLRAPPVNTAPPLGEEKSPRTASRGRASSRLAVSTIREAILTWPGHLPPPGRAPAARGLILTRTGGAHRRGRRAANARHVASMRAAKEAAGGRGGKRISQTPLARATTSPPRLVRIVSPRERADGLFGPSCRYGRAWTSRGTHLQLVVSTGIISAARRPARLGQASARWPPRRHGFMTVASRHATAIGPGRGRMMWTMTDRAWVARPRPRHDDW